MHNSHESKRRNETEASEESPEVEQQLKDELSRKHASYLRVLADFDNYRKRVERERASTARSGKREIILPLLEQIDSFERALHHVSDAPVSLSEGIAAIYRNLLSLLEAQGVVPFDSVGEAFDPERHEAIASVSSDEHESGIVVDEVQRGYRWGDEILRPARVRVAR